MFEPLKKEPTANAGQGDSAAPKNVTLIGEIQYSVNLDGDPSNKMYVRVLFFIIDQKYVLIQIEGSTFLSFLHIDDQTNYNPIAWTRILNELYYPYIEPENVRTKAI